MCSVLTIETVGDNFIYLYRYDEDLALVVDPTQAGRVLRVLEQQRLRLSVVLATHHHWDHVGGIEDLKRSTGCEVIGGDARRIPALDRVVSDGQTIRLGSTSLRVLATPGHTRTSVCYYLESGGGESIVWTGDTMFVAGCGRLFECDAATMRDSLGKLAVLPEGTLVLPGHDYTIENYEFALTIEPGSRVLKERLAHASRLQSQGEPTVPSTIEIEKQTNPFLRAESGEVRAALGMVTAPADQVFAELRRRKDRF